MTENRLLAGVVASGGMDSCVAAAITHKRFYRGKAAERKESKQLIFFNFLVFRSPPTIRAPYSKMLHAAAERSLSRVRSGPQKARPAKNAGLAFWEQSEL